MKIKIKCYFERKKKIITTLSKFIVYKFERSAAPLIGIECALHLTEQRDELFASFIQGATLDCSACSSYLLS